MNYQKSKFSLIFKIISLVLIQAFLVMDFAWAIGGDFPVTDKSSATVMLSPKISLNSQEVLDAYLYRSNNSANLNEGDLSLNQPITDNSDSPKLSRREFFKFAGKTVVGAAAVLTGTDLIVPAQSEARDINVVLKDLVISFDKGADQSELDKYIAIIESQGFKALYVIEQSDNKTLIRIKGLFTLDAEKTANVLNAQIKVRGMGKSFAITGSAAVWEESATYGSIKNFANRVSEISSGLGFGKIDAKELVGLYEGVTWVESKFHQWKTDIFGRIVPVKSYTNAVGVTQVIESQAVKQIAQLIVTHKGGISRYSEIINELERMISNDREKLSKAIKVGKEFIPESAEQKQFNIYDDLLALKNAAQDSKKREQIIRSLHRKIDSNPKLVGVNLYYALSVCQYLQKRNKLTVAIDSAIAKSIGQSAQDLTIVRNNKQDKLVVSGQGAYQPADKAQADLQFERDYFRMNLIYQMIGPERIAEILQVDSTKAFDKMMDYLAQQMMDKIGNQKLGYTYLTLNWDRYRRFELVKTKTNQYEFIERPLSYFKDHANNFDVSLAAAAAYNAGSGSVDNALLSFGNARDKNGIPLWIKNMIGANPQNIREPINYLRVFLEDKFINTKNLTTEEQTIKSYLVLERYRRIYKAGDSLLETRDMVKNNGIAIYADYKRNDGFDYDLANLIAQIAGSDYVDSFLRTHGLGNVWENEIFSKATLTFDFVASVLANQNDPNYANAVSLRQYLVQKRFNASVAHLDERVAYFESQEQARADRIELAQQMAKEAEWQKTVAVANTWVKHSALATAALATVAGLAWIMKRRVDQGKQAVPAPVYVLPLRALGLFGYATVQIFLIGGKIIVGAVKLLFGSSTKKNTQVGRSSLLDDQKVVRSNRRLNNQERNSFFSISNIKKIIIGAIIFIALVAPFLVPSFSHASPKQAQAPPAISLNQQQTQQSLQQKFNELLIEESKDSGYKQVDANGQLSEIKANNAKQGEALVFSNGKARERVELVNQLIDKLFLRAHVNSELDEYITKRGTSPEAFAFAKALFFLQIADPVAYAVLKNENVPLYMGNLYNYNGYTRGSRVLGILGKPMIFVNEKFIDKAIYGTPSYFNIALTLAHESYHVEFDSPITIGNSFFKYNIATFFHELFSGLPPNEQAAFKRQKEFVKFIEIVPIEGDYFYEQWKLEEAYKGNRNQNLFLNFVGSVLFNFIPLIIGWLVIKFAISKGKSNPSRRGGSGLLSNQKPSSRNRGGNRFRSIILIPLIGLQFSNFFNPAITQATEFFGNSVTISSMQNRAFYPAQKIPGTDVLFADVQKTNDILGHAMEMRAQDIDLVSFGEMNHSFAFNEVLLRNWLNADNITKEQARELTGFFRQDATLAAGVLKNGLFGRSFVLFGKAEKETIDLTAQWNDALRIFFPDLSETNPFDGKTFMQYRADSEGLLLLDAEYSVKDKFLLTIDLTDITTKGYFNRPREQIQLGIDRIVKQLKVLKEKGKSPVKIIVINSAQDFLPMEAEWTLNQIKIRLQELYLKPGEKISSASTGLVKGKLLTLPAIFTITAAVIGDLFAAANLWALENGADKVLASSDLKSIIISLFTFGLAVFIIKWTLKAISLLKQRFLGQQSTVVIPSFAALEKIKKLDNDIRGLFTQGKTQVIVAIDGPSGAGKTTLANYIRAQGIAGIETADIQVLSRDDYVSGVDYNEANADILRKSWLRGKLIIVEGQGIQWDSKDFDIIIEQPYNRVKAWFNFQEYQKADKILRVYNNEPAFVFSRQFALEQMLNSSRRELIGYHNEHHLNELFGFFDSLSVHLPFKDRSSAEKLGRMAIYLHDLGYFYSEDQLLSLDHEQRSKAKVVEFAAENPGLLSELEVQALIYMIDKTRLKIGEPLASEIAADNRAYDLLNRLNNQQSLNVLDQDFLNQFILTYFTSANLTDLNNRQMIMDTIFNGKTLALADVWGQEETYLYQVALLSEEFRYDKNIMLENNDPNAARNPAAMSNIEQVAETSGFQGFVQEMRLKLFLDSAEYPFMAMRQYLNSEQEEKQAQNQTENALFARRDAMIAQSKYIQSLIKDLTNGFDQNNNILHLNKNTDDLEQVKQLKAFIAKGFSLGIYDQARSEQLISEINQENGLIQRGIENQSSLFIDAVGIDELMPTVEDALQISGLAQSLTPLELTELIAAWEIKEFFSGQTIINQGDASKEVFLLVDGELDVFVDGYRVGQMSDGKIFGEIAVVENALRSATIRVSPFVSSPVKIAQIPEAVFRKLFSNNGIFNGKVRELIKRRNNNNQLILEEEATKDGETSIKDKFENKQLDTVVFIDVDLMRLTNQYVAKKNVNALLEVLEQELENVIIDLGAENAVSLRRGGDEFILAINSQANKQLAVDIASRIKQNVQSTKFSVASIGTGQLSDLRIKEIESFGCRIDKLGKHNIIIVAQEAGGKTGKARVQEFLDMVNVLINDKNIDSEENKDLSIHTSWLNRSAVRNEVSFTLSIGLANVTEADESEEISLYEKIRNLAAQRKDKSKEIFKKLGDGHIESQSDFERSGAAGESILLTESSRADFNQFENIQNSANKLELSQITDGFISENYLDLRYYSSETAARTQLNQLLENKNLQGAIAFSLQGLDYYDEVGKIDKYQKEYYDAPGAVKDNRIDIRDFKVVNEAHGYVAGDEILARLRTGAMRFAKIFENFDVILARGPPAGPNGFLIPKTARARQMDRAEIEALFEQYMRQVKSYFNQPGESVVKVGHLRVLWDEIKQSDKDIGEIMHRISQSRAVHEYTANPEKESDVVFQYGDNIQEMWMLLEEQHANQAVEQLYNLKTVWQHNKQLMDQLSSQAEDINLLSLISVQSTVLLERDIAVKSNQSI